MYIRSSTAHCPQAAWQCTGVPLPTTPQQGQEFNEAPMRSHARARSSISPYTAMSSMRP